MPNSQKPILSVSEQIEHLAQKGVKFELISKEDATNYLKDNNNYFKLRAYRKNFPQYNGGAQDGEYINLDFAQLQDLAIIDMRLRYVLLHMALDVEHFAKIKLLHAIEDAGEDGYTIVEDFFNSLSERDKDRLWGETGRNKDSVYCGEMFSKYDSKYPVWVFLEIVSFGWLIALYKFCADRFNNKKLGDDHYLLKSVKDLRNASAHNNCIINDLHRSRVATRDVAEEDATKKANYRISDALSKAGISKQVRQGMMQKIPTQQIVTLLYFHEQVVSSDGVHTQRAKELQELVSKRMFRNYDYYKNNTLICSTFDFLKKVVDKWFKEAYSIDT
ncbi:MAG: Abi family protein [Oscillospiraceae bacterium]|nr:Abi family protein [Oscillospiraceae bacterium]